MKTVLCATDMSSQDCFPSDEAAAIAAGLGCSLELLHVIDLPPLFEAEVMLAATGSARETAEKDLAARADGLARWNIPVATRVDMGRAEDVIIARARQLEAELIVVGTNTRTRTQKLLLGSVAERTVRAAPAPVMVVPRQAQLARNWQPRERALVVTAALDFSPASRAAIDWLGKLRRSVKCDLHVVHLYWPPRESRRLGIEDPEDESTRKETIEVLERELWNRVGALDGHGPVQIQARPHWGSAANPIGWEVETDGADVLVMGTSQERHSTAIATLRSSKVPVICVPAATSEGQQTAPARIAHVLVPTDFSKPANAAVMQALRLLPPGGLLTLCHVAPSSKLGLSPESRFELGTMLLALVPVWTGALGIRCRTEIQESADPGEAIVQVARRVGADAIVMATHGRTGLGRALLGSVANTVMGHSPVPVTMVPPANRQ